MVPANQGGLPGWVGMELRPHGDGIHAPIGHGAIVNVDAVQGRFVLALIKDASASAPLADPRSVVIANGLPGFYINAVAPTSPY